MTGYDVFTSQCSGIFSSVSQDRDAAVTQGETVLSSIDTLMAAVQHESLRAAITAVRNEALSPQITGTTSRLGSACGGGNGMLSAVHSGDQEMNQTSTSNGSAVPSGLDMPGPTAH